MEREPYPASVTQTKLLAEQSLTLRNGFIPQALAT
jgi:hypothetical protein